jgi:hypothetical protein
LGAAKAVLRRNFIALNYFKRWPKLAKTVLRGNFIALNICN